MAASMAGYMASRHRQIASVLTILWPHPSHRTVGQRSNLLIDQCQPLLTSCVIQGGTRPPLPASGPAPVIDARCSAAYGHHTAPQDDH